MIELNTLTYSVVSAALIGVIWLIRLEAKLLYLEKDHNKLDETSAKTELLFQAKVEKLSTDLNEIKISLARIESSIYRSTHQQQQLHKGE